MTATSIEDYSRRKQFFDNLKHLVKSEYEEIYRIIKINNITYTENSNGIFFDVSAVSIECLVELEKYMEFCMNNRKTHEDRLHELQTLKTVTYQT